MSSVMSCHLLAGGGWLRPDGSGAGCRRASMKSPIVGDFPHDAGPRWCDHPGVRATLLIVDDHAGFRRLARSLLQAEGFDVIGEAGQGRDALVAAARLRRDVVLLDILLPDIDGFEVAQHRASQPAGPGRGAGGNILGRQPGRGGHGHPGGHPMRVILADDATVIRRGLARLLADEGIEVCGQAGHPDELLRLVRLHRPDVAIVDIRMPPTHTTEGLAAAGAIRADFPGVGVLLLSQYIEVSYALRLLERAPGAVGYLLKDRIADLTDLTDALRRVAAGETVIDPALVAELTAAPGWPSLRRLTAREREVLALLAEGRTDRGIAQILYVTRKTVEAHVRSIFNKLDVPVADTENRRVHAVLAYLRENPGRHSSPAHDESSGPRFHNRPPMSTT
jgi:DNA-binding NarL/FixJ family response regulator